MGVQGRCSFNIVSCVRGIFDDPYSTKVPSSSVFDVLHETVARRPLFRMVRFTSAPYWFFELNPFRVARVARSGFFDI